MKFTIIFFIITTFFSIVNSHICDESYGCFNKFGEIIGWNNDCESCDCSCYEIRPIFSSVENYLMYEVQALKEKLKLHQGSIEGIRQDIYVLGIITFLVIFAVIIINLTLGILFCFLKRK